VIIFFDLLTFQRTSKGDSDERNTILEVPNEVSDCSPNLGYDTDIVRW
jgi:hypothetical protein